MATFLWMLYWRHLDAVKAFQLEIQNKYTIMELAGFSNVIIFATLCLFVACIMCIIVYCVHV